MLAIRFSRQEACELVSLVSAFKVAEHSRDPIVTFDGVLSYLERAVYSAPLHGMRERIQTDLSQRRT